MRLLTEIETIRFYKKQIEFLDYLHKIGFKPDQFIRLAFDEKIERDFKKLVEKNKKELLNQCPF